MEAEDFDRVVQALQHVWDYIGDDALGNRNEMPRDEVFEVCLDADRPETLCGLRHDLMQEVYANRDPHFRHTLKMAAFPDRIYGR